MGRFALRPVDPDADGPLIHSWLTRPYAHFWDMQQATLDDVVAEYRAIAGSHHREALLGDDGDEPAFLMESYGPAEDPVGAAYEVQPGDRGMHFITAPVVTPRAGFTTAVLTDIVRHLFEDAAVTRVVVEPDVRNHAVHRLNERVGFEQYGVVTLPGKQALLSICTRAAFEASIRDLEREHQSASALPSGLSTALQETTR